MKVRSNVPLVSGTNKHPQVRKIPMKGVKAKPNFPMHGVPEKITVHEGDFVAYIERTYTAGHEGDPEHCHQHHRLARVFAIAHTDGCGEELKPLHLAVITVDEAFKFAYLRLIDARDVCGATEQHEPLPRWFFGGDFNIQQAERILRMHHYGSLNNRFLGEHLDAADNLVYARTQQAYRSVFVFDDKGVPRMLQQCEKDFEDWLLGEGFTPGKQLIPESGKEGVSSRRCAECGEDTGHLWSELIERDKPEGERAVVFYHRKCADEIFHVTHAYNLLRWFFEKNMILQQEIVRIEDHANRIGRVIK